MLTNSVNDPQSAITGQAAAKPHKVLRMMQGDRTAGAMPVWELASNGAEEIESALSGAQNAGKDRSFSDVLDSTMGYNETSGSAAANQQEFGFGDLLDMVNPLQHIPVVGHLYREFTGDDIRPIGQIVGGALFGGPLGAAAGVMNAVIEDATGKDVTGNAFSFMLNGDAPEFKTAAAPEQNTPEQRLGNVMLAMESGAEPPSYNEDNAAALLSFTDLKSSERSITILRDKSEDILEDEEINWTSKLPPREPITTF
jgi:hypothetical protein